MTILSGKTFCDLNQKHVKSLHRANSAADVHSSYICRFRVEWAQIPSVKKLSQTAVKTVSKSKIIASWRRNSLWLQEIKSSFIWLLCFLSASNIYSSKAVVVWRMSPISHIAPTLLLSLSTEHLQATQVLIKWSHDGSKAAHSRKVMFCQIIPQSAASISLSRLIISFQFMTHAE